MFDTKVVKACGAFRGGITPATAARVLPLLDRYVAGTLVVVWHGEPGDAFAGASEVFVQRGQAFCEVPGEILAYLQGTLAIVAPCSPTPPAAHAPDPGTVRPLGDGVNLTTAANL